jgi:hypothetical protein
MCNGCIVPAKHVTVMKHSMADSMDVHKVNVLYSSVANMCWYGSFGALHTFSIGLISWLLPGHDGTALCLQDVERVVAKILILLTYNVYTNTLVKFVQNLPSRSRDILYKNARPIGCQHSSLLCTTCVHDQTLPMHCLYKSTDEIWLKFITSFSRYRVNKLYQSSASIAH